MGALRIRQYAAAGERLETKPFRGGVCLGVPTRHSLMRALVIESTEPARNGARHAIEPSGIPGDGVAQLVQLRPRRHPDAGANHRPPARLQVKVVTCAPRIRLRAHVACRVDMVEPAGRVGLVGRLVLRKTNVAVDAEHRSLGISANLRGELREACIEILDQLTHRLSYLGFILFAMCLEPGLLVVPGESSKESE